MLPAIVAQAWNDAFTVFSLTKALVLTQLFEVVFGCTCTISTDVSFELKTIHEQCLMHLVLYSTVVLR